MAESIHDIIIRSPNGVLLAPVGTYRAASYTLLVNDVGDFSLEFPIDYDTVLAAAINGNHIEFRSNSVVVFGGYIQHREIKQAGPITYMIVSGPSWLGKLNTRIVNTGGSAFDSYVSVNADDLLKRLFKNHCGSSAPGARQLPYFECATETSSYATLTNYNGRYETVLEAMQAVCKGVSQSPTLVGNPYELNQLDLFFDIIRNPATGNLLFRVLTPYFGTNHIQGSSAPVVMDSSSGNISEIDYIEDSSGVKNYVYGGGAGDAGARLIREGYDSQSILDWGRIETFLDSSSDATSAALDLSILKQLASSGRGTKSLTFKVNNAGRYRYGIDYTYGDKITAIYADAGVILSDMITGCTVKFEEGQLMDVDISIGVPNLTRIAPGKALASYIQALRKALGQQLRH